MKFNHLPWCAFRWDRGVGVVSTRSDLAYTRNESMMFEDTARSEAEDFELAQHIAKIPEMVAALRLIAGSSSFGRRRSLARGVLALLPD